MATERRLKILTETEMKELYGPPLLNANDQRFFFALNEIELVQCRRIRRRDHRCMFVALLGYFKVKPVLLSPGFHRIKHDLKYITSEVFPGPGLRPFNLTKKARIRIYNRILELMGHRRWDPIIHQVALTNDLDEQCNMWAQPRSLFDRAIEFLSSQKVAIPGYSVLQDVISHVLSASNGRVVAKFNIYCVICSHDFNRHWSE